MLRKIRNFFNKQHQCQQCVVLQNKLNTIKQELDNKNSEKSKNAKEKEEQRNKTIEEKPKEPEKQCSKHWNIGTALAQTAEVDNEMVTIKIIKIFSAQFGALRPLSTMGNGGHAGIVYFELRIECMPKHGRIELGLCKKTMALSDFYVFDSEFRYSEVLDNASKGDVVGCGVRLSTRTLFYTVNGKFQGSRKITGVNPSLAIKLCGDGMIVKLGPINESDDESNYPE